MSQVPFERSYWIIKGQLLAGGIPAAPEPERAVSRVKALMDVGVDAIINLMEEDECDYNGNPFFDYAPHLIDNKIKVYRFPIRDMAIPSPIQMSRILAQVDDCINNNKVVYVHCWGGLGRTGTVIGCYLIKKKIADTSSVLDMIIELKKDSGLSNFESPQTEDQRTFVLEWD